MSHVFNGRRLFNADISGWDVSRVTTMAGMFANAAAFNQPIGAWDVGRVDNMMFMFYEASAFNQPIGGWNMRRVTNAHRMLDGADAFQQWVSGWSLDELSCPFFLQDLGEHRLRVAGVDLEWYPSQRGRQIDQWLRAHDMVVTVRRSIHHTILWGKLPEELVRAVGQWLGLDIMKCILP
jgi:surface protein